MAASTNTTGFSPEERAAMRERTKELKASQKAADLEKDQLAKIAEMQQPDRDLAERIQAIVTEHAPSLRSKTYYGMPGYANGAGKVVLFFQAGAKFGTRYATLGFNDLAALDDGPMWPTAYAIAEITPAVEQQIVALVKKAAG